MNFAFFGSPQFAAIVLDKLIAGGFVPSVVICNPDRPVGRKKIVTAPAVKQLVAKSKKEIEILQPERLDATSTLKLKAQSYDIFIVAAYSKIIPKDIIALPRFGVIGVHPSLLPRHRGATPIQTAILEGDGETGTTLFLMDEKIDHGAIIAQERLNLSHSQGSTLMDLDYQALEAKLSELSGDLLVKTLPDFVAGKIKPAPQDDSKATLTKKFTTQDAFVDEKDVIAAESGKVQPCQMAVIERKIRAFSHEPGAWTLRNGKRVKLLEAEIREGRLVLKKIQIEGGKSRIIQG
ncbi:MAG: methionyl-tRNA formyltransferase [Patescibacteria group bacterium]|nr:methionyl-tRNA formyltransferase [Patescibacteria group bacterium]